MHDRNSVQGYACVCSFVNAYSKLRGNYVKALLCKFAVHARVYKCVYIILKGGNFIVERC